MATSWVKNTTFLFSNMDGLGTEYADGDDVQVAEPGNGTIDLAWSGSDGSRRSKRVYALDNGIINMENGVKLYFYSGASSYIGGKGRVTIKGEPGGGTEIGEDDAGHMVETIWAGDQGIFSATNVTFGRIHNYFSCSYGASIYLQNCSGKVEDKKIVYHNGAGTFIAENCTFDSYYVGTVYVLQCGAGGGIAIFKDCAFGSGIDYIMGPLGNYYSTLFLVGDIVLDGDTDPKWSWFLMTDQQSITWAYYPKLKISENNNVEDALISVSHPLFEDTGIFTWDYDQWRVWFPTVYGLSDTDSNGDGYIYPLCKIGLREADDTKVTKYFSDSGQAETGDNQKYTVRITKNGYIGAEVVAWGNAGTVNLTLSGLSPPSIDSVTLSSSSITNRQQATLTVETGTIAEVVTAEVYGDREELDLDSDVGGVRTWIGYLSGADIGVCTTETITIYASSATETATNTAATLTVTQAVGVYGPLIKAIMEEMQSKLRNAGAGYPYLNAVASAEITIGEKLRDYDFPLIFIAPDHDSIRDLTTGNQQISEMKFYAVVEVKDYDTDYEHGLTDLIDIAGDVFDLFMHKDNRTLSNNARTSTVSDIDWASIEIPDKKSKKVDTLPLHMALMEVTVEFNYRSGSS